MVTGKLPRMRDSTYIDAPQDLNAMQSCYLPSAPSPAIARTLGFTSTFCRHLLRRFEKPLTGAVLTLALGLMASTLPIAAQGAELPEQIHQSRPVTLAIASAASSATMPNGVYLYGQSPRANQLGATYLVFEVNGSRVVGAFYMPQSSFDCFYGEMQAERMALTVVDSYEQTTHAYSVPLQPNDQLALAGGPTRLPVQLINHHRIDTVSAADSQVLNTCKADLRSQI